MVLIGFPPVIPAGTNRLYQVPTCLIWFPWRFLPEPTLSAGTNRFLPALLGVYGFSWFHMVPLHDQLSRLDWFQSGLTDQNGNGLDQTFPSGSNWL